MATRTTKYKVAAGAGAALLVLIALARSGSSKPKSIQPLPPLRYVPPAPPEPDGPPISYNLHHDAHQTHVPGEPGGSIAANQWGAWKSAERMAARYAYLRALHPDASNRMDGYSHYRVEHDATGQYHPSGMIDKYGRPIDITDEFGRTPMGTSSSFEQIAKALSAGAQGFSDALASAKGLLKSVTDSPLWSIAQTGASFIPGIGTAVSVGMSVAYAYGHDLSLKDAALSAARAALPGGPAAQAGFDVAVALASGQSATDAALAAARNQVPAGPARVGFDQGVAIAKGKPLTQGLKDGAAAVAADELRKRGY